MLRLFYSVETFLQWGDFYYSLRCGDVSTMWRLLLQFTVWTLFYDVETYITVYGVETFSAVYGVATFGVKIFKALRMLSKKVIFFFIFSQAAICQQDCEKKQCSVAYFPFMINIRDKVDLGQQ